MKKLLIFSLCSAAVWSAFAGRQIVVGDESQGYVRFLDDEHPENDFSVKVANPVWDLKKLGKYTYRAVVPQGFAVVDLTQRKIVDTFKHPQARGVSAVVDLPDGGFVCVCAAKGALRLARFSATRAFLANYFYRGIFNARKARAGANGEILVTHDSGFARLALPAAPQGPQTKPIEGRILASYKMNRAHNPYDAVCARDGNGWWLSCGYGRELIKYDRDGRQEKVFQPKFKDGKDAHYYAQIEERPDGHIYLANWNGHGREDGLTNWQAVELDANGNVVWHLHRPTCGSFTGFYIQDDPLPPFQEKRPFASFSAACATPDSMAVDAQDRLLITAPNFSDTKKPGALWRLDNPGDEPFKLFDLPADPETGRCSPMGLTFGASPEELFIVDNQPWTGEALTKNHGRVLRITMKGLKLTSCEVVASGLEHPNGIRYFNGKLYLTASSISGIKDPSGLLVSGIYCFDATARNVKITNSAADKNLVQTFITKNKFCQYGLDGIVFAPDGKSLYVGNFGDGEVFKMSVDAAGRLGKPALFAKSPNQKAYMNVDPATPGFLAQATKTPMRTTDGMTFGPDGWLYVADFSNNAVAKVSPDGKTVQFVRQDPDGRSGEGLMNQPGEPIFWRGRLIAANFDAVVGNPDKTNAAHEPVSTLTEVK